MVINQKLKQLRKRKGLSQLELSEKVEVSRQAVSGWESGTSRPSTENLQCLNKLYNVPLEVLLDDDKELEFGEDKRCEPVVPQKRLKSKKRLLALVVFVFGILIAAYTYHIAITVIAERKEKLPLNEIEGGEIETDREKDFDLEWR